MQWSDHAVSPACVTRSAEARASMHVHCPHEEDVRAPSVQAMTVESAAGLSQHTSNAIGLVQGQP